MQLDFKRAGAALLLLLLISAAGSSAGLAAADLEDRLADFAERTFLGAESGATPLDEAAYADVVDYYEQGLKPRKDVMADKAAYFGLWPRRRFTLDRETLFVKEPAPGRYDVFFEYTFDVENAAQRVSGRGNTSLLLQREGQGFLILHEAGDVLQKQVVEKAQGGPAAAEVQAR